MRRTEPWEEVGCRRDGDGRGALAESIAVRRRANWIGQVTWAARANRRSERAYQEV